MLRLIAAGHSNGAIAEQLSVSIRTIGRHTTNLYAKIDARGKADATADALRHGPLPRPYVVSATLAGRSRAAPTRRYVVSPKRSPAE